MSDEYDSHSEIEEREWTAGKPPLGHDDPVLPNPHRDDPDDEPEDVPAEDEADE